MRILIFIAVIGLLVMLAKMLLRHFVIRWVQSKIATPPPTATLSQQLVQCETCHTFFPASQAIKLNDCYYCCKEHTK